MTSHTPGLEYDAWNHGRNNIIRYQEEEKINQACNVCVAMQACYLASSMLYVSVTYQSIADASGVGFIQLVKPLAQRSCSLLIA